MDHPSYKEYKHAKREFKKAQVTAYKDYQDKLNRELEEAAECNIRNFRKLIHNIGKGVA